MKIEDSFHDLRSSDEEPTTERIEFSSRPSCSDIVVRALLCFFSFALLGSLLVMILAQARGMGSPRFAEFLVADLLCGAGGTILLWVISGCGLSPFRDSRSERLLRYVAQSRQLLDGAEIALGAAHGIRAYLEILEQGARTLRRGGFERSSVEALLKLQSECSSELRAVLNELSAPSPDGFPRAQSASSVRDLSAMVRRLGAFLIAGRKLSFSVEVDQGIQSGRIDSRTASSVILAALRECVKSADAGSSIQLIFRESTGMKTRACVRLIWQARSFTPADGIFAVDTVALSSMLRPVHGGLAIQTLSGSQRVLEITLPLLSRPDLQVVAGGKPLSGAAGRSAA